MVVFDYKDDYKRFLRKQDLGDRIIRLAPQGGNATWNLFEEIETNSDVDVIARELFGNADARSGESSGYFQGSARHRCSPRSSGIY